MVSIIIPSRNERFLAPTVRDVLARARGDIEVLVILDGYWDHDLPSDPRLHLIHRGVARGMRDGINSAAAIARGEYLMKLDGHCAVAEGFDVELARECDGDWVVVPRRYALDPDAWGIEADTRGKYPIDAHYLSYPYERPDDWTCGLHGTEWRARRDARTHIEIDDEMSSQGSCWFMSKAHFWRTIGPMDQTLYGSFVSEFQEVGCKTWLSGGRVAVNKRTWYAHLYKGRRFGRGYTLGPGGMAQGPDVALYWMCDRWPGQTRPLRWLIEKFWPVPTWPADLDEAFAEAHRRAAAR